VRSKADRRPHSPWKKSLSSAPAFATTSRTLRWSRVDRARRSSGVTISSRRHRACATALPT
jgi:hypothetical protein